MRELCKVMPSFIFIFYQISLSPLTFLTRKQKNGTGKTLECIFIPHHLIFGAQKWHLSVLIEKQIYLISVQSLYGTKHQVFYSLKLKKIL